MNYIRCLAHDNQCLALQKKWADADSELRALDNDQSKLYDFDASEKLCKERSRLEREYHRKIRTGEIQKATVNPSSGAFGDEEETFGGPCYISEETRAQWRKTNSGLKYATTSEF